MVWAAGADGCKGGWFRASRETESGELHFDLIEEARDGYIPRLALELPTMVFGGQPTLPWR